jgi:hypothetical protein
VYILYHRYEYCRHICIWLCTDQYHFHCFNVLDLSFLYRLRPYVDVSNFESSISNLNNELRLYTRAQDFCMIVPCVCVPILPFVLGHFYGNQVMATTATIGFVVGTLFFMSVLMFECQRESIIKNQTQIIEQTFHEHPMTMKWNTKRTGQRTCVMKYILNIHIFICIRIHSNWNIHCLIYSIRIDFWYLF